MSATGRFRSSMESWARSPASNSRNWPFTNTARQDCALDEGKGLPVPQVTTVILEGSSNSARRWSAIDCRWAAVDSTIEEMGPAGMLHAASGAGGDSLSSTSPGVQVEILLASRESALSLQPEARTKIEARQQPISLTRVIPVNVFIKQRSPSFWPSKQLERHQLSDSYINVSNPVAHQHTARGAGENCSVVHKALCHLRRYFS